MGKANRKTPRVRRVEETAAYKKLFPNAAAKRRFDKLVEHFRRQVQPELDAIDRCTRLTDEDYKIIINARAY